MVDCRLAGLTRKETSPRALKPGNVRLAPKLPSVGTNEKSLEAKGESLEIVPVDGLKTTSRSG